VSEYFLLARITSTADKKGFVKIDSYSDFPERFFSLKEVYIDFFGTRKKFFVEEVKKLKGDFFIRFRNFNTDKDTKVLLNREIFVEEKDVVKLPENVYFVHDLLGSQVFRNGKLFGKIKDVLPYPANDVYVIEDVSSGEILLPALSELIESFDPENKVMVLKPGESFYEDED
jgi:16S rRNA processing protein RimM